MSAESTCHFGIYTSESYRIHFRDWYPRLHSKDSEADRLEGNARNVVGGCKYLYDVISAVFNDMELPVASTEPCSDTRIECRPPVGSLMNQAVFFTSVEKAVSSNYFRGAFFSRVFHHLHVIVHII